MSATEKDAKSNKIKSSILLHCIGEKGREIYSCFTFESNDDKMKFSKILGKFDEHCNPRKNLTFLRYKFFHYRQEEGESFDDFVTQLKKLSADCEFGEFKDSLIRDVIIIGVSDNRLCERLLREPSLSLDNAIKYDQATEETKHHAEVLQRDSASQKSVQQVRHRPKANKVKLLYQLLRLPNIPVPVLLKLFKSVNSVEVLISEVLVLRTKENVTTVNAKNWSRREQVELKYLSEWKDQLKELVIDRISNFERTF